MAAGAHHPVTVPLAAQQPPPEPDPDPNPNPDPTPDPGPNPNPNPDPTPSTRCPDPFAAVNDFSATVNDVSYRRATARTGGAFRTGQDADILLSGIDFNNSGGPRLYNHPTGVATDGTRLLLTDRFNNRVLVWTSLPNSEADDPNLVLGQPDFAQNNPGTGRNQLNWPGAVAVTPGGKVVVADSYNDRLLIWNSFPTRNQQPADIVIGSVTWPWGVWTDGNRLVATMTQGGAALFWNAFPTVDNQTPSLRLTAGGNFGTPRTITSNGERLIIGDHNARNVGDEIAAHAWRAFPTADRTGDFVLRDPLDGRYAWLSGAFTRAGELVLLGRYLHVWSSFPDGETTPPRLSITSFPFTGGDGSSVAIAGDTVFVAMYNGNRIVVYRGVPDSDREPDFAVGSPDVCTNTLQTRYIVTNGVPASNGRNLLISSDFDRRIYVWRDLPDESGAPPDVVIRTPDAMWDNDIWNDTFVTAGQNHVYVWRSPPLYGERPDVILGPTVGSAEFRQLKGVALDDRYLYVADNQTGKLWIWEGIPTEGQNPKYAWDIAGVDRLDSDGRYLAVNVTLDKIVRVFRVADLGATPSPYVTLRPTANNAVFNLQMHAVVGDNMLMVADTGFSRVQVWTSMESAAAGRAADIVLGEASLTDQKPELGRNKVFWPGALSYDGTYLWMGEYKFSNRVLRFSRQR